MKKNTLLLLAVLSIVFFICCKKNSTQPSTNKLSGTWKFISMTAHTQSIGQYNDGAAEKDISTSDYTTTNNAGTVQFSGGTVTSTGITYAVSTTVFGQSYTDNVLVDTFSLPFSWSIQPSSSVSTYKLIGTDSLFFPGGGFVSSQSIGGTVATVPSGYKFSILGDSLNMTSNYLKDTVETISGITESVNESIAYSVLLIKQ